MTDYRISRKGRPKLTHGITGTRIHRSWCAMRQRCLNPRSQAYARYGARGIGICPRWINSFENFVRDMGRMPAGFVLDRIDNDGDYAPSNCRWVSLADSNRNKKTVKIIRFAGRSQYIFEWAKELKMGIETLRYRIKKWGARKALTTKLYTPREKGLVAAVARWGA